jgi:predicted nucleic acid-binding protein
MSYLLDTNVVSEVNRPKPNRAVLKWFQHRPPSTLYISVLTLGEIRKGAALLPESAKRRALLDWLEVEMPAWFHGRILSIDLSVADRWGQLQADAGRTLPAIDSLLAATALHHNLTLVTRNTADFGFPGIQLINPWDADPA